MKRLKLLGVLLVASLLAAACGGGTNSANGGGGTVNSGGVGGSVTISNESGQTWTCGFNPFNGSDVGLSFGTVYEELYFIDSLKNEATTPWLATSYAWTNGSKTLTFTIRPGVKWTDGQPFTAADVVYTFNLIHGFKGALDLNAVWSVLQSVSLKGSNQVVFQFKSSAVPYFYYIADETPIVPEHLWSKVKNPVNYNDSQPIGTGPYEMNNCSAANIKYTRNPSYWQAGEPKIATVYYPSFTDNGPANEELADGQAQWGSQYIPGIKAFYLDKSANHHIWFPPVANVDVFINLKDPLLSNLAIREAMAYAINRSRVSQIGETGYEPPSNQAGIVQPTFTAWFDSSQAAKYGSPTTGYTYNPAKAISILQRAGFKEKSGLFYTSSGKPLSFTIDNISGYSDWEASVNVIQAELKAVGISITPNNLASNAYTAQVDGGHFQLAYNSETGGPAPYYEFRQWLYSANSAPIGQNASSNWERYSNPKTDALINEYGSTTSTATQHQIVDQLEGVLLSDVPVIPITEEVDWYQYDTSHISGWVTPSDPYAQPAAYSVPDIGVVLLHLKPTG